MNIRIVTASAGTGKTTRLAQLLDEAVREQTARPNAILATTFTKQAAAELLNRARTRLLQSGQGQAAQALLAARIGTVNAVCGSLVTDYSFELGLSPELRVLDEASGELELKRALATVVTDEVSNALGAYIGKFDQQFDWQYEVRRLIEAARSNGIGVDGLAASAERSVSSLDACLGPVNEEEGLDGVLQDAITAALDAIARGEDDTKGTQEYCGFLRDCRLKLERGALRWGAWAKLGTTKPTKASLGHARAVQAVAVRHLGHPRLRAEMHRLIRLMFQVAAEGLRAYQERKRDHGLLDFVDQEVLALKLLTRPDLVELLRGELDLVLVDEFQDTSPLQLAIFLKLASVARQSVWVGDPKQAIYGFRGTDPALMDAAIEALTSPSSDPELVAAAVEAVGSKGTVETLSRSFRSRPELVELTNDLFARAFSAQQGMAEERVRLVPTRVALPELGSPVLAWFLVTPPKSAETLAAAAASGVRNLLEEAPSVLDRSAGSVRPARAGDLGILCRTNQQCLAVAEALGELGVPCVVARVGLLDAAEAQVVMAALRLWVDPRDRLAAATLARILEYPDDAAAFVEVVVAPDSRERLFETEAVRGVCAAKERFADVDVLGAFDAVCEGLELRRLCAAWGRSDQRIANVDALRAHATAYLSERRSSLEPATVVGLIRHLDELATPSGWGESRGDTIARLHGDAVTVSTWHAAKGLEWPLVVLFGLESLREPDAYGVHVLSDRTGFEVDRPLEGRWIHFWPNPYTTSNQGGPVKDRYAQSPAYGHILHRTQREALRVLYVGWTRARDQLILAAQPGKMLQGLLGVLTGIDAGLISEPAASAVPTAVPVTWAGRAFSLQVTPCRPSEPIAAASTPGTVREGRAPGRYAPATLSPSSAAARAARLGAPVRLGAPMRPRHPVEVEVLGTAVHAFLAAADGLRDDAERLQVAGALLGRFRVSGSLTPHELVEAGQRLSRWIRDQFGPDAVLRPEWPVSARVEGGTLVQGTSDLVVESARGVAVIDHKSYGLASAQTKVAALAGQLDSYAEVLERTRAPKAVSRWLHLPFEGVVVEVI